jgi:hypothetical protein
LKIAVSTDQKSLHPIRRFGSGNGFRALVSELDVVLGDHLAEPRRLTVNELLKRIALSQISLEPPREAHSFV